eukprot:TRINITY_DN2958_c0_g1_i2.p1 TRINITY_DN2958_c0_g1~~TRINITY_DN2958_c0_g1_i2.p1  ORF type:complete len:152 (+),score=20.63 TRINITY_DN2958_c0_g1_i2:76-531(+)
MNEISNLVLSKILSFLCLMKNSVHHITAFSMINKSIYFKIKKLYPFSVRAEILYQWKFYENESEEDKMKRVLDRIHSKQYCLSCGVKSTTSIPNEWIEKFNCHKSTCWKCFQTKYSKFLYTEENSFQVFKLQKEDLKGFVFKHFFSVKYSK